MTYFIPLAFSFQFYTLVFFAVSEISVPFISACYSNGPIDCSEYPPDYVECDINNGQPNSTLLGYALTYCTEGKSHRTLYLIFYDHNQYSIEVPLNVSDNITILGITHLFSYGLTVRIIPLKQHLNMKELSFQSTNWDQPNMLSTNFPNLQGITIVGERSINTIDSNLFRNLTSLTYISWRHGSLVNVSEDCFRDLSSLSYLDLSSNRISYLSSETFQHLPSLNDLIVSGSQLNCTCHLQWMSIVDSNYWIHIVGDCLGSSQFVDSPSTYSQCHSTESYQCFNKSISCDSVCINTPSSYVCACTQGYGLTLIEAEQACHDIDECVQNTSLCEGMNCRNTLGSYQCYCEDGFLLAGNGYCSDVDECTSNPCEHYCSNTLGSYVCSCNGRFVLNRDAHTCQCESGYESTADRAECVDIDECLNGNGGCDHICINSNGSYTCSCYVSVNSSLTSDNTLLPVSALFIGISILQTVIIIVLIITLIICICLKRAKSEGNKESDRNENKKYTELKPKGVPTSEPGDYIYLDEEGLRGALTGAPYPTEDTLYVPMQSPKEQKPSENTRYMNLNDM